MKAERVNTVINITGLALGLGVVTIVLAFIMNELGYNGSFDNGDRIYRVLNHDDTEKATWGNTPYILGETLKNSFPEIENSAHQYNIGDYEVKKDDSFVKESSILCTEASFFEMFGVDIVQGDINDFGDAKLNVMISRSLAEKYFGRENATGKILNVRISATEYPLMVTGVFNDIPENSSFRASIIASIDLGLDNLLKVLITTSDIDLKAYDFRTSWSYGYFFTNYLLISGGASVSNLEKDMSKIAEEHTDDTHRFSFSLQPLSEIYFNSGSVTDNNSGDLGNKPMLYILATIGILILVIACINYLNLSSAQALSQTKSMAVRKVCGASKTMLINQMVFESVIVSLVAFPLAILIADAVMPFISRLLGKNYDISLGGNLAGFITIMFFICVLTGSLSGLLVSFRITSFSLTETLKGRLMTKGNRHLGRKAMVVFQMIVFIALLAVMILVQKQVRYAFTKDLGFVKEGLIRIPLGDHNYELFKQEARKNPDVISVSGAIWMPPHENHMNITLPKVDEPDKMVAVKGLFVDYGFATTMGIKIIRGDDFDASKVNSGVMVNEMAVKALGLTNGIGEQVPFGQVVGVIADFNMYSLHEAVSPLIIGLQPSICRDIAVRIKTDNVPETVNKLKKIWSETGGTSEFEFEFTDDILKRLYESDSRFSQTIGILALVAIFIAALGLFGLSLLVSRQKTKEIGMRRVNGATVYEIITLLNRDYFICVAIAFFIAAPVAWFGMNRWLENFAYKTDVSWWIFAVSGLAAMLITVLSVSYQSYRAATRNPVEALRYE